MDRFEQHIRNEINILEQLDKLNAEEAWKALKSTDKLPLDVRYNAWESHIRLQCMQNVLVAYIGMQEKDILI